MRTMPRARDLHNTMPWTVIAKEIPGRSDDQCRCTMTDDMHDSLPWTAIAKDIPGSNATRFGHWDKTEDQCLIEAVKDFLTMSKGRLLRSMPPSQMLRDHNLARSTAQDVINRSKTSKDDDKKKQPNYRGKIYRGLLPTSGRQASERYNELTNCLPYVAQTFQRSYTTK